MAETVAGAVALWLRQRYTSGEISGRTRTLHEARFPALLDVCGTRLIGELDRAALRQWAQTVGGYSPATRRAYLSTVRCFCRWCVDEGFLVEDPSRQLPRVKEPKRVPRARSASDVSRVLAGTPDWRERTVIMLMVEMGLRACEVANCDLGDYDRRAATLLVRGKFGNERVLPVPGPAAETLDAYRDEIGWRAGPLICDRRSRRRPLTAASVSRMVSTRMRQVGVKRYGGDGVTPHTFRHTAASDVLDVCGNVRTVQTMLGQVSLASTEIYLRRASLGQLREAMEGRDYRLFPPADPDVYQAY